MLRFQIIAETVSPRFEIVEAVNVRPLRRRVTTAAGEGHRHVEAGVPRRFLDRRRTGKNDCVGHRQTTAQFVNFRQDARQLFGLVDRPVLLRSKADARAIGTAAMV